MTVTRLSSSMKQTENIVPKLAVQSKRILKDRTNNPLKNGTCVTKLETKASLDSTYIVADEAKKEMRRYAM